MAKAGLWSAVQTEAEEVFSFFGEDETGTGTGSVP
jgi:hypothetical protein